MRRSFLLYLSAAILLLPLCYLCTVVFLPPWDSFGDRTCIVEIRRGLNVRQIGELLYRKGVIKTPWKFALSARLLGWDDQLKAGRYEIPLGKSNYRILRILVEGKLSSQRICIPEGATAREIASILRKGIQIDSIRFIQLVNDGLFCRRLGIEANSLEGYLFPDTYDFYWGIGEETVIEKLVGTFKKVMNDSLRRRAYELGMTVHQVVTLASIIEGEAMVDGERALISAVYHNRLKKGMCLQADPTIQYIIKGGPRRLLKKDLEIDSPYNTYKYPGLPPGPVNNPGRKSIIAALYPAPVDYLYFVAKGDGSHVFSRTLREHLLAKRAFDRIRREVMKEGRNLSKTK